MADTPSLIAMGMQQEAAREALITRRMTECIRRMQERVQGMAGSARGALWEQSPLRPPRTRAPGS